jgi:hypothetical protein
MFCTSCGSAIPQGNATCVQCGAPAPAAAAAPAFAPSPQFAPPGYAQRPMPQQASSTPWLVIGLVGCGGLFVVGAIIAALAVPMTSRLSAARSASRTTDCKNNLKQIGVYMSLYESQFRAYPPDLKSMWRPDMATNPDLFTCPVASGRPRNSELPAPGTRWESFSSQVSYVYRHPSRDDETSPNEIVAWDRAPHPDGTRCVLYFQGRVDVADPATFERLRTAR